jgi:hypothetical protein
VSKLARRRPLESEQHGTQAEGEQHSEQHNANASGRR